MVVPIWLHLLDDRLQYVICLLRIVTVANIKVNTNSFRHLPGIVSEPGCVTAAAMQSYQHRLHYSLNIDKVFVCTGCGQLSAKIVNHEALCGISTEKVINTRNKGKLICNIDSRLQSEL